MVVSDGLGCFAAVADAGCNHLPLVVGALKPRHLPQFKWVNTVLGNLKTTLAGAFHSLKCSKYASHYLVAFAYRFNRRFDLRTLVARLIVDVSRCGRSRKSSSERRLRHISNQDKFSERYIFHRNKTFLSSAFNANLEPPKDSGARNNRVNLIHISVE